MIRTLTDELHIHLYGCLDAAAVWELGRDRFRRQPDRLAWYETEYEKAYGRRPNAVAYWTTASGQERLKADFEFTSPGSFNQFQARFNLLIALFPVVPDDTTVLRWVLAAQRQLGIRFGEYRCPVPPHLTPDEVVRYVGTMADATLMVAAESGAAFTPRLALSLARVPQLALAQHAAIRSALDQRPARTLCVTGIDFCGVEAGHPPAPMRPVFQAILKANQVAPASALAILYHVGESFSDMSLMSAMRWVWEAHAMGAHRLGHGIALGLAPESLEGQEMSETLAERRDHLAWLLAQEAMLAEHGYAVDVAGVKGEQKKLAGQPAHAVRTSRYDGATLADCRSLQDSLLENLAAHGAVLESCPTSNFRIGAIALAVHHPLPRFLDAGVTTIVSSDDPGIFAIGLGEEEDLCRTLFGLSGAAIARLKTAGERCRSAALVGRPALGP